MATGQESAEVERDFFEPVRAPAPPGDSGHASAERGARAAMETERQFTRAEIEGRNTRRDNVIIIDNVVYDVTEFLDDHPGGTEVLLDNGGKDASRCFHDVGHSDIALEWRKKFRVGEVVPEERREVLQRSPPPDEPADELSLASVFAVWGTPLTLAALAVLIYIYLL